MANNLIEIIVKAIDQSSDVLAKIGAQVSGLDAKLGGLVASGDAAGKGITTGLAQTKTALPEAEIARLKAAVDQLPDAAVSAAGGTDSALKRIVALEARANIKALDGAIRALPEASTVAASGATAGLADLRTTLPAAEIKRLDEMIAQLPAAAVTAAGGADAALARIVATEAKANIKTLDAEIAKLSETAVTASNGASKGLDTLRTTLPADEIKRLDALIAKLPETAVKAAGGTDAALARIVALEAKANVKALDSEIAKLPGTATSAGGGIARGLETIDFSAAKQKVTEFGDHIVETMKRGAEAIGLLGVAGGALDLGAVKLASDYQTNTTNAQNNTTMTPADMAAMRSLSLSQAGDAAVRPGDTNQAFMHAENLTGNADISAIITRVATESAKSTGDDPTKVTNILAQIFHEYGYDKGPDATKNAETNATRLMGQAHLAAANANMTLPEFSQNFGQISAWAANLGVPPDQAMATYAMMTKHGFDPADAATQVKDIFPHIIKPSAGALGEAGNLDKRLTDAGQDQSVAGEATTDRNGNPIGAIEGLLNPETLKNIGLSGIFDVLHQKFTALGLDESEQTAEIMKLIPNIRGGAATFTAIGQGAEDYQKILGQLNDTTLVMSVTHDAFARTQATLQFQWDKLKASGEAYLIQLGDKTLPLFTKLTEYVSNNLPNALAMATTGWDAFMKGMSGNWANTEGNNGLESSLGALGVTIHNLEPAFNALKGAIGGAFSVLGSATKFVAEHTAVQAGLVTVLTAVGIGFGVFEAVKGIIAVTKLWAAAQEILNVAMDANPIGLIVVAVAALSAGLIYAYNNSDTFRAFVNNLGDALKQLGGWIGDNVIPHLKDFASWVGDNIMPALGRFKDWFISTLPVIGQGFDSLGTTIQDWFAPGGKVGQFFDAFGTKAHDIVAGVGGFFDALGTKTRDVFTAVGGFFDGLGTKAHDITTTVGNFFDALGFHLDAFRNNCKPITDAVGLSFSLLGTVAQTVTTAIGNYFDAVGTLLGGWRDTVKGIIQTDVGGFFDALGAKAHDITTAVGNYFNSVGTLLGGWRDVVRGIIQTDVGGFFDAFGTKAHDISTAVGDKFDALGTRLGGWRDTVKGIIQTDVGGFFDNIGTRADTLRTNVTDAFQKLQDWLSTWGGKVKDAVLAPFDGIGKGIHDFLVKIGDGINWVGALFAFNKIDFSGMPGFAGGLNWQGGAAWVGEKGPEAGFGFGGGGMTVLGRGGPEIRYVPKDATIIPHQESKGLGLLPGFAGGLGAFGDAIAGMKALGGEATKFLQGGLEAGVAAAMQKIGLAPTGHGVLDDYPAKMLSMAKDGIADTFKNVLGKVLPTVGAPSSSGVPPPGGDSANGNAILAMAQTVAGAYGWCEKFVGDVMIDHLGLRYFRATSAEAHSHMQDLQPGLGPAGSIVFYPYVDPEGNSTGHVAFSGGNGRIFGTTAGGTGWGNGYWTTPYGYTQNPYENGGWINEPVLGRGMISGQSYSFAEKQREYVIPGGRGGGASGGGSGDTYHISVNVAGTVASEGQLIEAVHNGLLRKQRLTGRLGLTA